MPRIVMVQCLGHGDLFVCLTGSVSAEEELCTACVILNEHGTIERTD